MKLRLIIFRIISDTLRSAKNKRNYFEKEWSSSTDVELENVKKNETSKRKAMKHPNKIPEIPKKLKELKLDHSLSSSHNASPISRDLHGSVSSPNSICTRSELKLDCSSSSSQNALIPGRDLHGSSVSSPNSGCTRSPSKSPYHVSPRRSSFFVRSSTPKSNRSLITSPPRRLMSSLPHETSFTKELVESVPAVVQTMPSTVGETLFQILKVLERQEKIQKKISMYPF